MKKIEVCPSTLRPGFSTYSPIAVRELFDGVEVSPFIDINFENERDQQQAMENMNNMSISGAQEKFSAIIDDGKIRLAHKGEQATYILKPAPFNLSLSTRKQIPANEHLTMQIASQVYGISTASNGLCFSSNGQPVYITKRFDVINGVKEISQEDFATVLQMTEEGNDSNFKYHKIPASISKVAATWDCWTGFRLILRKAMCMTERCIPAGLTLNDSLKESDCQRNVLHLCSICLWRFHKRHTHSSTALS